jgi:hypothetical protein
MRTGSIADWCLYGHYCRHAGEAFLKELKPELPSSACNLRGVSTGCISDKFPGLCAGSSTGVVSTCCTVGRLNGVCLTRLAGVSVNNIRRNVGGVPKEGWVAYLKTVSGRFGSVTV